jgi:predicted DNA-binding transcriptional regulator YafY
MPATKNQNERLEILDELLSLRGWTMDELLQRVNARIGDSSNPVTRRTLFRDINYLIDTKNAPVHRPVKGDNLYYYTGAFSLKNIPLDSDDLASLKNAVEMLRQVGNLELIREVDDVIRKLENRIHIEGAEQPILLQFEKHTSALGTEHIQGLMDALNSKTVLRITYHPYSRPQANETIVHPYLLKEFRNRWFLLGREGKATRVTNYALDRIKKIRPSDERFVENDLFDPADYFNHLIGVSVPEGAMPEDIEIKVYKQAAPYVRSKPIHLNQEVVKQYRDGSILVRLKLIINYELKSVLLSYGPGIVVRRPRALRETMQKMLSEMGAMYQ